MKIGSTVKTWRDILLRMTKTVDRDRISKAVRSKKECTIYKKKPIRFILDLSNEILQAKR